MGKPPALPEDAITFIWLTIEGVPDEVDRVDVFGDRPRRTPGYASRIHSRSM